MQEITDFINKNEIIKQIPLFLGLNWFESRLVLSKLSFFEYKKNEIIYNEGNPPDFFYLLVSGRLQIFKVLSSGQEKTLECLMRGKYFGIISLLTGKPHSVSVRAMNDSLILKIQKEDFDYILKHIPKLAVHMSTSLSRRLRRKDIYPKEIFESKIISIISPVGEVGKSMYSTNLALSLRKETNKRAILLDMGSKKDVISQILDLKLKFPPINLTEISVYETDIKESIIKHASGIELLCVTYGLESKKEQSNIAHLLSLLVNDYHHIIIDLPLGLDSTAYVTLRQSDLIHVVTDGQKQNLILARKFIEELESSVEGISEGIFIIINEVKFIKKRIPSEKKHKLLGERNYIALPTFTDSQIKKDCFAAVLRYPDSEYARAVRKVARQAGEVMVGLALSGGSALGLAHIGVLKVLEEAGICIDVVSGSSIGAFIGGFWASGIPASELEKIALHYRNKLRLFRMLDLTFPRLGLIAGKQVLKFFKKHLKGKTFEDLKISFRAVACDLESRREVVFDEGSLAKALRASISIPGVFVPFSDNDRFLMDGGVLQPLPVQPLIRMGVGKIIAVNVLPSPSDIEMGYRRYRERQERERQIIKRSNIFKKLILRLKGKIYRIFFPNIFDAIVIAMQASEYVLADISCKQSDICIHPDLSGISWFEFYRAVELIKQGEEETRKLLPEIKKVLSDNTSAG